MRDFLRPVGPRPAVASGIWAILAASALGALSCSSGAGSSTGTGGGNATVATGGNGNATGTGGAAAVGTGGTTAPAGSGGDGSGGATAGATGGNPMSGGSGGAATGGTGNVAAGGTAAGGRAGTGGAASGGTGMGAGGGTVAGGSSGMMDLFNGTDLTGFNVYKASSFANNAPGVLLTEADAEMIFKPENGTIHVYANAADQSQQVHYLLMTVATYTKYNLSWDYKWGTKKFAIDATGRGTDLTAYPRDAGLLWHIHGDKTQVWPSSIEFQNKWGSTGDIYSIYARCNSLGTSAKPTIFAEAAAGGMSVLVDGSTGFVQHARSANYEMAGVGANASTGEGSDWNTCLLQVDGGTAVYSVNGKVVNRVLSVMDKTGKPVTSGYIAWQGEQAEVYYRNLRMQVLP